MNRFGFLIATLLLCTAHSAAHASWYDLYLAVKAQKERGQVDWVEYYRQSPYGYPVNGKSTPGTFRFAPVFVSPTLQWAVPNGLLQEPLPYPPAGAYPGYGYYGPSY